MKTEFQALKDAARGTNDFTKLCDAIFEIPGIEHGFLQQLENSDLKRGRKLPSGIGWEMTLERKTRYRVCLWSEKGLAEEIQDDCREAIRTCLRKLNVAAPAWL